MLVRLTGLTLLGLYGAMALAPDPPSVATRNAATPSSLALPDGVTTDGRADLWLAATATPAPATGRVSAREAIEIALRRGEEAKAARKASQTETTVAVEEVIQARIDTRTAPEDAITPWVVTGTVVNLRGGPSTTHPVVGQVRKGDRLTPISSPEDTWIEVRGEGGATAWIFGRYLAPEGA